MATAKKMPSGRYRVRIYVNDLKTYKSFTADTKREAERIGTAWLIEHEEEKKHLPKVETAAEHYMEVKKNVLSPSTLKGYRGIINGNFDRINDMHLDELDLRVVQDWINELAFNKSAKTVHNVFGLLTAILNYYDVSINLSKVRLPKKVRIFKRLPEPELVIETFRGTDIELPVLLGLWCGMRMSEIMGVRKCDIDKDNILTISQVVIDDGTEEIIKKNAKTYNSNRRIKLPKPVMDLISKSDAKNDERIVKYGGHTSNKIYRRFKKAMGLEGYSITFHDLRHINASVMIDLGVPDIYAMERGGWSSPSILKGVYQQTFSKERQRYDAIIDQHFYDIYTPKYDTRGLKQRKNGA